MNDIFLFLWFLGIFLYVLYTTRNLWIDPQAYIDGNKRKRAKFSGFWSLFPFGFMAKFLDNHSGIELWYSRIVVLIMYLIGALAVISALIGVLNPNVGIKP
jgi:hypothetical protein